MYMDLAVLCSCIGRKGMFFHACMRAVIRQDRYAMDLSLYRSEQQLVKWSQLDQHIAKIVYYYQNKLESTRICTRITFCRGGSLFAAKSDPAGSIIATKSDPAGSLFTRINYCVTGPIPPEAEKKSAENEPCSISRTRSSYARHVSN